MQTDVDTNSKIVKSIIVSHNSRIQCLLAKIGIEPGNKIRFQNCCILKIIVTESIIDVSLIYSGKVSSSDESSKKIFYCAHNDARINGNKYIEFENKRIQMDKLRMGLQNVELKNTYVFYVVRHGQSEHNENRLNKLFHHELDTSLTSAGVRGAEDAKFALLHELGTESANMMGDMAENYVYQLGSDSLDNFDGFFVSDLVRTRQTMKIMTGQDVATVLPCASEVAQVGQNGDCDATGQFWNKMARENYPSCTLNSLNKLTQCKADWKTYLEFYGNQIRGESNTRMKCRDTNMLALAIYILDFNNMSLDQFMTKDTRFVPVATDSLNHTVPGLPRSPPVREPMQKTKGVFYGYYGGTKRTKLKRKRTRRRR